MLELGRLVEELEARARVEANPGIYSLRERALRYSVANDMGVPLFHTRVCARMRDATIEDVNRLEGGELESVRREIGRVREFIENRDFIMVERSVALTGGYRVKARIYVSSHYPHLPLMFSLNYFPAPEEEEPLVYSIDVPEYPRRLVLVDPEERTTLILGSDYYGELKMSALRMAMNYSRDYRGMLGVHAASKAYYIDGAFEGLLIFGLSGTGKSTVTFHLHEGDLREGESVHIKQDDINIVSMDSYAAATEQNFYPKTDSAPSIPNLMRALRHSDTVLENVAVRDGRVDFGYTEGCHSNARAIAIRHSIEGADLGYDMERVTKIIFLTRRTDMPVAAKVAGPEQAAAYFMLGESVRTSAGTMDPREVGKPVRVPGFDPFIIGPRWRNGVRFYDLVKNNPWIETYIFNTGHVGDAKIRPSDTLRALLAVVRGEVEWSFDESLNLYVPHSMPGVDVEKLDPRRRITGYDRLALSLREERRRHILDKYPEVGFLADYI